MLSPSGFGALASIVGSVEAVPPPVPRWSREEEEEQEQEQQQQQQQDQEREQAAAACDKHAYCSSHHWDPFKSMHPCESFISRSEPGGPVALDYRTCQAPFKYFSVSLPV